jgi:hypothetical protein
MEFGVSCSPAQMRKLKSGGAVTLNRTHFMEGSPHRIMVMPNTGRRIMTAMKKNKGVRIALKPEEDIVAMTEGGKISLKSIGKSFKKAFDPKGKTTKAFKDVGKEIVKTGDVVKRGFQKEVIDSGLGKKIAKELIDVGTEIVLPAATGAASMALGDPTGISGAVVGKYAGDYLQKEASKAGYGMAGKGLFKTLNKMGLNKIGINKKSVTKFAKDAGKVAVRAGAMAAGTAITAYTGNPVAGMAFERIAVGAADRAIDSKSSKDILKNAGRGAKKTAKMIAVEAVDNYIDENLTGAEKAVAEKALAGRYPSAADLVYDYSNSKIEEQQSAFGGYGIPRRTRGGLRMGRGMAHLTPAYAVAMRSATTGAGMSAGFPVNDGRMVTPSSAPSDVIQTGSPFQRINSAAMSPFIPASPQLANQPIMGGRVRGGSFYPAGRTGGSFLPA